jgi:hypothetical protein
MKFKVKTMSDKYLYILRTLCVIITGLPEFKIAAPSYNNSFIPKKEEKCKKFKKDHMLMFTFPRSRLQHADIYSIFSQFQTFLHSNVYFQEMSNIAQLTNCM